MTKRGWNKSKLLIFSVWIACAPLTAWSAPTIRVINQTAQTLSTADREEVHAIQTEILSGFSESLLQEIPETVSIRLTATSYALPQNQNCTAENSELIHGLIQTDSITDTELSLNLPLFSLRPEKFSQLRICGFATQRNPVSILITQEILRFLDRKNAANLYSQIEKTKLRECRIAWQVHAHRGDECFRILSYKRTFSDRAEFLSLMGWSQYKKIPLAERKSQRGEDPYELYSPENYFLLNGALFLMDPGFKCRRPDLASYFARKFRKNWNLCDHKIHVAVSRQYVDLQDGELPHTDMAIPHSSVYEIHYVLADEGDVLISSFGHSMFRLIICAPWRQMKGPECLTDTEYHLTASFEAIVEGEIDMTKQYPTRLFVEPFPRTVQRYAIGEDRSLKSFALTLTGAEMRDFLFRLSFTVYNYQSPYGFITNNCATQAFGLIASILHRPLSLAHVDQPAIITPNSLVEYLERINLLKTWRRASDQKRYVNDFPAIGRTLNSSIAKITQRFPDAAASFEREVVKVKLIDGLHEKIQELQTGRSPAEADGIRRLAFAYADRRRVELRTKLDNLFIAKLAKQSLKKSLNELAHHPVTENLKTLNTEMSRFQ